MSKETRDDEKMDRGHLVIEQVRKQIMTFGDQIREYFDSVQAETEHYKFTDEKHGEGIEIEAHFKAYIHPKGK
jgi:hypothetical protein